MVNVFLDVTLPFRIGLACSLLLVNSIIVFLRCSRFKKLPLVPLVLAQRKKIKGTLTLVMLYQRIFKIKE